MFGIMGIFLGVLIAFLQLQTIPVDFFDTQSGLSNNIVYDIYQDREGFIWVATENGLNRFDGYEFEIFQHSEADSTSIADNIVRTVIEDDQGRLWAGTFRGLNLYDRKHNSFSTFRIPVSFGTNSSDIQKIFKDSKGKFWFLINSKLMVFDPDSFEFELHDNPHRIFSIVLDSDDQIWLSTYDNELYKTHVDSPRDLELAGEIEVPTLLRGYEGERLYSFNNNFSDRLNKWNSLPTLSEQSNSVQLLESADGTLWIGTETGLYIFDRQTGTYQEQRYELNENSLSNSIRRIYEDEHGGIWIGTLSGLFHIDPNRKPFNTFDKTGMIMGLEPGESEIWVNYFSQGLTRFDYETKSESALLVNWDKLTGADQIWDIRKHTSDEILLATNAGLFRYHHKNGEFSQIRFPLEEFLGPVVFSLVDLGDELYVLGQNVLNVIDGKDLNFIRTIHFGKEFSYPLLQDLEVMNGDTLVASESWGIFQIMNGEVSKWKRDVVQSTGLQNTSVWDLFKSSNGSLWIGSNKGLFEYNEDRELVKHELNGKSNTIVFSVTEDEEENLWLGTEKGIVKYERNSKKSSFFDPEDGTGSQEFNRRSVFRLGDEIFMGGMKGVTYFTPSEIRSNTTVPTVHITETRAIKTDSERTFIDESSVELNWEENTIEIDFVALNYSNPTQNQYRYQLAGYDPDWVDGGVNRTARYVRLPAGDYTFRVIASNNDGVWDEVGDAISIVVKPPYWQTPWFKILIGMLMIALVLVLYRYRVRQLLEVERVRLRIAGDLHDEIGSGLSGIALTGDILQTQARSGEMKPELLSRITHNARNLASSLDAIVWLIDPNKERLGDLIQKCRSVASEILNGIETSFTVELNDEELQKQLSSEFRRNIYLIFKESVHNIHKHAEATQSEIVFKYVNGNLELKITDNGKGYVESEVQKGNGLDSLRRRGKEIGEYMSIISEPGSGTIVQLIVKLP